MDPIFRTRSGPIKQKILSFETCLQKRFWKFEERSSSWDALDWPYADSKWLSMTFKLETLKAIWNFYFQIKDQNFCSFVWTKSKIPEIFLRKTFAD